MSVLDLFSASPGIRAATQSAGSLLRGANQGFDYATGQLNTGAGNAIDALKNYGGQAINTLGQYGGDALAALTGDQSKQIGAYEQGIDPWKQLFSQYAPGAATYWSALGIPDPGGNVAGGGGSFGGGGASGGDGQTWGGSPVGQFQASPGYDYTLGQGIEAASRVGQSTGQLGAANMDAMKFAHNLSDQDYQQWINNLLPSITGQQNAAQGIQQGYNAEGAAYGQGGRDIADLLSHTGSSIAGVQGNQGTGISGIEGNLGTNLANLGNTYYNNKGNIKANKAAQIFGAQQGADTNTLNALFGIANLGVNAFTGGLGSGFGSLFGGDNAIANNPSWTQTSPGNWTGPSFGGYGDVNL